MIAKTESGFEIELDDEAMNDVELVEAIVEMDTDGTKLFYVADRLLGKEGKKKLYDHLRDAKGRVPVVAFGAAIGELIRSFSAGKKRGILKGITRKLWRKIKWIFGKECMKRRKSNTIQKKYLPLYMRTM